MDKLEEKSEMFLDYFGIEISTGQTSSMPSDSKNSAELSKVATPARTEEESPDKVVKETV